MLGGGDGQQGLHGVYSLQRRQSAMLQGQEENAGANTASEVEWSIVRAGYSHR